MKKLGTVALFLAGAAASLAQTPSVTFLGMDTTTLGNWKGVYGQDGFVLADYTLSTPSYSIFNAVNVNQRLLDIWSCSANHTCDPRELNKQPYSYTSAERVESYYYNRMNDDFQVNTSDGATHRIALYLCDYEFYGRQVSIIAHNTATGTVLDTRVVSNYSGGVYLIYNYTGAVDFEMVDNITPTTDYIPNGTVSGIFWGGSGGPPSPAPNGPVVGFSPLGVQSGATVSGTVPIQVSLDDVPGVTSVQLQLDGQNLGAPMHYFVTNPLADNPPLPFNYSWDTTTATNCIHTITALAVDSNGNQAASPSLTVTVNNGAPNCSGPSPASPPTFSPVGGTYTTAQQVYLNTTTSGASIRYTTDGSTPTETVGTLYTGSPISVASTTTIKAIAYENGIPDSTVSSATYTIQAGGGGGSGTLALVQSNATATNNAGNMSQSLTLPAAIGAGDAIFVFAQYYNAPVTASASDSCNDPFTQIPGSPVTINSSAGSGTAHWFVARNVAGGNCQVTVTYSAPVNYGGIAIFEVSGLGMSVALDRSASGSGDGTLASASLTPTQPNSFAIAQVWSNGGGGNTLGGNWTTQERLRFSTLYQSNMAGWQILNSTSPVSLFTQLGGGGWIAMVANFYDADSGSPGQAATPTFNPAAGTYTQPVAIGTTTAGATIRYTTDGSTPSETNGTVYSTPIALAATTTIKAIAYKAGLTDSGIASATYTVSSGTVGTPMFNPAPGPYTQPVAISTSTTGATIRYTTDGSTPSETAGTVYSTPITLAATTTIKAIAYKAGLTDSGIVSGTYTVGSSGFNAALVQSNATASSAPGNSSQSVAFSSAVTSGNTIFVFAQYYSAPVTATASDNCNDTFTQITGSPAAFVSGGANGTAHWFIAKNVTGGTCTVKVTYNSPTNYGGVAVFEVSGLGGLNVALDQYSSGTGTGTLASTSITPTHASSFAIAQVWSLGGGGFALGGSWTTQERTRFSTTYQSNMAGWQVLSSTAPASLATSVGGGPWIAMIANFYVP
jgi:hypothetical protein